MQVKKCQIPRNTSGNKNKLADLFLVDKEDFFFDTWASIFYNLNFIRLFFKSIFRLGFLDSHEL